MMLPEGLEERFRQLRRRPKERAALRADREAAATRLVFASDPSLFVPELPLRPARAGRPAAPVDTPGERDTLAGLDAEGRPVLVRSAFGTHGEAPAAVLAHPSEEGDEWVIGARLLTWSEERVEIVGFLTARSVSHVTWIELDEAGRPLSAATVGDPHNDVGKGAEVARCDWDGDRCVRVRIEHAPDGEATFTSELVAEYDDDGLVRVRSGDGPVVWGRDRDAPEPDPLDPAEALDAWGSAIAEAAQEVAAAADDPVVVQISASFEALAEPTAVVVERVALAELAGRVEPREAVDAIHEPRIPLAPLLGEEGLRAWRSLRHHEVDPSQHDAAADLLRRVSAQSWLPLVSGLHDGDRWALAEEVLGAERVAAAIAGLPAAATTPEVDRPPRDRAELAALLEAFGLSGALADEAAVGYALVAGGSGRSRLGGVPELPEGIAWPACDGRPLTHLATIDLAEVPGDDRLPSNDLLAFFADLSDEGELFEPVLVADDERVRVIEVAADAATMPPAGAPPPALTERRVRFEAVLTLPERPSGLSDAERVSYDRLHERLLEVTPGLWRPPHLVLGHPSVVQGDPREAGDVSVLHLGWDPDLGFEHLDAGDLTFYGAADDVQAGRWERLTVHVASH